MSYTVYWTTEAEETFEQIVDYLKNRWGLASVLKFTILVEDHIKILEKDTATFTPSKNFHNVFKIVIHPHTTLIYRKKPRLKHVELITFWQNRKNPKGLRY